MGRSPDSDIPDNYIHFLTKTDHITYLQQKVKSLQFQLASKDKTIRRLALDLKEHGVFVIGFEE